MIETQNETHISLEATAKAVRSLSGFIPPAQIEVMGTLCRGEEGDFFRGKFVEFAERVATMPKTYEQDGLGDEAVAHLHYFSAGADWWITEKDKEAEQHQAFGYADLGFVSPELCYISLVELCQSQGVEIDLHFEPTSLSKIKTAG